MSLRFSSAILIAAVSVTAAVAGCGARQSGPVARADPGQNALPAVDRGEAIRVGSKLLGPDSRGVTVLQDRPRLFGDKGSGHRRALIIGNADYVDMPLANPVNDATLLANRLLGVGFDEVTLARDLDRKSFRDQVNGFVDKLGQGDIAFVFYAGHGLEIKGENYLLPIDFDAANEDDAADDGYRLNTLLNRLSSRGHGLNIVVLDACRNDPFSRRWTRSTQGKGFRRMESLPMGTYVAFSTAPGALADDGVGDNSPFASALAANLSEPGVELDHVFRHVREAVYTSTEGRQSPWTNHTLVAEFYFVPGLEAPDRGTDPIPVASATLDVQLDESLGRHRDPFRWYLDALHGVRIVDTTPDVRIQGIEVGSRIHVMMTWASDNFAATEPMDPEAPATFALIANQIASAGARLDSEFRRSAALETGGFAGAFDAGTLGDPAEVDVALKPDMPLEAADDPDAFGFADVERAVRRRKMKDQILASMPEARTRDEQLGIEPADPTLPLADAPSQGGVARVDDPVLAGYLLNLELVSSVDLPVDFALLPGAEDLCLAGSHEVVLTNQSEFAVYPHLLRLVAGQVELLTPRAEPLAPGEALSTGSLCHGDGKGEVVYKAFVVREPIDGATLMQIDRAFLELPTVDGATVSAALPRSVIVIPRSVRVLAESECGTGDPSACLRAAHFRELHLLDPASYFERALTLGSEACAEGDAAACLAAGEVTAMETVGYGESRAFLARACELGANRGCVLAAQLFDQEGAGGDREPDRALELLETACERDPNIDECALLGISPAAAALAPASEG